VVNVGALQKMVEDGKIKAGDTVTIDTIIAAGVTKKALDGLKVLGNGEISVKLTIVAASASASAMEKVSKAGGSVSIIEKKVQEGKLKPKAER
jgi:large subunit ribosomal protein L15